jgi:RNA polymerase sigma factor (sigma-70 family)
MGLGSAVFRFVPPGAPARASRNREGRAPKRSSNTLECVDQVLAVLEALDPRQAEIVELRFFGGLTIEEVAELLGISPATVKREWTVAKVWLRRKLNVRRYDRAAVRNLTQPWRNK